MKLKFTLSRPTTFIEGSEYLMKESTNTDVPTLVPVKFVAYEPHSAFVIVRRGESRKRCSRDNLFIMVNGGNE
jgi:hypothetical protein